jgi:hypothetical protein
LWIIFRYAGQSTHDYTSFAHPGIVSPSSATPTAPHYVPGAWSQCSTTCGAGVRTRTLDCYALQPMTRQMLRLPDYECEPRSGSSGHAKPESMEPCQVRACAQAAEGRVHAIAETTNEENTMSMRTEYTWIYGEWSECSATCLGGQQRSSLKCVEKSEDEKEVCPGLLTKISDDYTAGCLVIL